MMQPEIIHDAQAYLGESPAWDAKDQRLYWVDILGKRIHCHEPGGSNTILQLDLMPGCLAPCKDGDLIIAANASFLKLKPDSAKLTTLESIAEPVNNRFNDGKCDPRGRFLAGTMDMDEKTDSGALYSFDGKQVTRLLDSVRISNGMAWSPDYKTFYYIDTPKRVVTAFSYDTATGQIANSRVVISVPKSLGWPDGMTSDTEGCLWIAMWGGAQVTRWNPQSGKLLEQIPVPAKNVTSCVFGGSNLNDLFITSARIGLDRNDMSNYKGAGSLVRLKSKAKGLPTFEFE